MRMPVVRLREKYSEESIALLHDRVRFLVLNAEADVDISDPDDAGCMHCVVTGNAAWRELEKLSGE
jgi:hypothetical protein